MPDYQAAFAAVFGQGLWTICGLAGRVHARPADRRRRVPSHPPRAPARRHVWLRATGSTAVSQLVDSFVVLYIAFVLGPQHWPTSLFLAVGTLNYAYKMLAAIALIPLLYLVRAGIHRYLGHERARAAARAAPQPS